jgi:hypothetical protein
MPSEAVPLDMQSINGFGMWSDSILLTQCLQLNLLLERCLN